MRWEGLLLIKEAAVADLEGIVELVCTCFLEAGSAAAKATSRAIRFPGELLNGRGAFGDLLRFTTGHVDNEDLVVLLGVGDEEGYAVAGG